MNQQNKIEALVRPNIRALKPYTSARDEFRLEPSTVPRLPSTVPRLPYIFLDANENSLGSPLNEDFSRYPDPHQRPLKALLAEREGLPADSIFLGNGSDEAIDLLLRAFCAPGQDNVIVLPPTYGMYAVLANIHGAELRYAPLRPDFSPDAEAVQAMRDANSKILFICSPNNPTGNDLPETFIREMLTTFPGIVVVDEAYNDFSSRASLVRWLPEFPNLVVLKTFSKAWGLAGLRVGMAFASPFVISVLNKIKYPYNLGTATIQQACSALKNYASVQEKIRLILSERQRLINNLEKVNCIKKVFHSDANFILIETIDADGVYRYLCDNNIVVRNRTHELHCNNCLRITIGSPTENDRLIDLLYNYSIK